MSDHTARVVYFYVLLGLCVLALTSRSNRPDVRRESAPATGTTLTVSSGTVSTCTSDLAALSLNAQVHPINLDDLFGDPALLVVLEDEEYTIPVETLRLLVTRHAWAWKRKGS